MPLTLIACGDIGLYGALETKLLRESPLSILGDAANIFKEAHIVFANLEGTLSDRGDKAPLPPPYPSLRMHPKSIDFIKEGSFTILSLANNHMLDYGEKALLDTQYRLDIAGIHHVGAGRNHQDACRPKVIDIMGTKCGFLAFQEGGAGATNDLPGSCKYTEHAGHNAIHELRKYADIVIVSYHFGFDYFTSPSPYHIRVCRRMIDEGADLILGHHPHVPQGYELYKGGLIVYSLGDFVAHLGDKNPQKPYEGIILKAVLSRSHKITQFELIPYLLDTGFSLKLLQGREKDRKLMQYSLLCTNLSSKKRITAEWYKNIRNYYSGYLAYYWRYDIRNRKYSPFASRIMKLFELAGPNKILLSSAIKFVLSGYFIKAEFQRMARNRQT